MPELGGGGGQFLADQLTLFQPRAADSAHPLLLAPQNFFTFRHRCYRYNVISQRGGRQLRKGKKGLADMGASRVHYPSNLRPSRQTLHKVPGKLQMLQ